MQRKHLSFEQVFDVRAARVIVGSVADCYAALGIVHGLWSFLPSEFDDYIATPKGNDYRSIHTAVSGPDGRPLEIQIRTAEMQAQAELGVAAHWRYKEGGAGDLRYEQKIQEVRELLAGPIRADSDELARLANGLFDDRVYAMTPKGEVVDLPTGGTPLDFAFHLHSGLGERCRGAKINGRIVPLTQPVRSGDVVEILTAKTPAPSRDWLSASAGYLVSSRARSKLRAYFRRLDEAQARITPAAVATEPAPQPTELERLTTPRRTVEGSQPVSRGHRRGGRPPDHAGALLRAGAPAADPWLSHAGSRCHHPPVRMSGAVAHGAPEAATIAEGGMGVQRRRARACPHRDRGVRPSRPAAGHLRSHRRGAPEHRGCHEPHRSGRSHCPLRGAAARTGRRRNWRDCSAASRGFPTSTRCAAPASGSASRWRACRR